MVTEAHQPPPKPMYNHLQPPTTTSKYSTTTHNHLKNIYNTRTQSNTILNKTPKTSQMTMCHVHEVQELNNTSPPPKILLSMVPLYNQPRA